MFSVSPRFNSVKPWTRLKKRPISANPGLKFWSVFVFYLPTCCVEKLFLLSLLYRGVNAQQDCLQLKLHILSKKPSLKTRLNPGLNLTIFRGTGPWSKILLILLDLLLRELIFYFKIMLNLSSLLVVLIVEI